MVSIVSMKMFAAPLSILDWLQMFWWGILIGSHSDCCRKDIKAIYVGHDHSNDFIMDFNGLSLVYGRKTGDGCYGPAEGYVPSFLIDRE